MNYLIRPSSGSSGFVNPRNATRLDASDSFTAAFTIRYRASHGRFAFDIRTSARRDLQHFHAGALGLAPYSRNSGAHGGRRHVHGERHPMRFATTRT